MFWTLVGILILLPIAGFVASVFWGAVVLFLTFVLKLIESLWSVIIYPFALFGRFLRFLRSPDRKEQLLDMIHVEKTSLIAFGALTLILSGVFLIPLLSFYL